MTDGLSNASLRALDFAIAAKRAEIKRIEQEIREFEAEKARLTGTAPAASGVGRTRVRRGAGPGLVRKWLEANPGSAKHEVAKGTNLSISQAARILHDADNGHEERFPGHWYNVKEVAMAEH